MNNAINWRLFAVLLIAGVTVGVLVLPYTMALSPQVAEAFGPALLLGSIVQSLVLFSIAIFLGLLLAPRVGFGVPILEGWLKGESQVAYLKSILGLSVGLGVLGGILVIVLSLPFGELSITFLKAEMSAAPWKGFLASFYGGIGEEIFFRLFLMTLVVWVLSKIMKTPTGHATSAAVWIGIVLSSIIFGLGHLGISSDITAIAPVLVLRAVLLNGVVSLILGWLYWKKGLEAAMLAHFSADIVVHVITPLAAAMFI